MCTSTGARLGKLRSMFQIMVGEIVPIYARRVLQGQSDETKKLFEVRLLRCVSNPQNVHPLGCYLNASPAVTSRHVRIPFTVRPDEKGELTFPFGESGRETPGIDEQRPALANMYGTFSEALNQRGTGDAALAGALRIGSFR
jgi:hypothetical protein